MTDKIERQYRWPPEVCRMLEIVSTLIGRTMEDASAIAIQGLYDAIQTKGNIWAKTVTDEELKNEITAALKQNPKLIRIVQETLSTFSL